MFNSKRSRNLSFVRFLEMVKLSNKLNMRGLEMMVALVSGGGCPRRRLLRLEEFNWKNQEIHHFLQIFYLQWQG